MRELLDFMEASFHWWRAQYYAYALCYVGHTHPDASELTRRYLDSRDKSRLIWEVK